MTSHLEKSIVLAERISAKAADTLASAEREMTLMKWPDEFRAIMWEAISDTAAAKAKQARARHSRVG